MAKDFDVEPIANHAKAEDRTTRRGAKETHVVIHKRDKNYHVDSQEWSQVNKDPRMAVAFTERGAKKRATQLNKYHDDSDWQVEPASKNRW